MPDDFHIAVERAQTLFGKSFWGLLSTHEQAAAIYREIRALDAERVARVAAKATP